MHTTIADPGSAPPTVRRTVATIFCCLPLAVALTALSGCEALFQSNFDATPAGEPPAQIQATGTASVFGPPGSVVVVDLNTAASPPTADFALFGTGASGSKDYAIRAPAQMVNQFGAIRVWMGYPWTGQFDATGLLVTHATH